MARIKRGKTANKKRKAVLKQTKGFKWGRKNKERAAKEALLHALSRAFKGRKEKKRNFRALWNVKINAALRGGEGEGNMTYSRFIALLKKKGVELDRKILAELAEERPEVFKKIVDFVR